MLTSTCLCNSQHKPQLCVIIYFCTAIDGFITSSQQNNSVPTIQLTMHKFPFLMNSKTKQTYVGNIATYKQQTDQFSRVSNRSYVFTCSGCKEWIICTSLVRHVNTSCLTDTADVTEYRSCALDGPTFCNICSSTSTVAGLIAFCAFS